MVVFGEIVEHLYFTDLPRAVSFYAGMLGFSLVENHKTRVLGVQEASVVRRDLAAVWLHSAIPEITFPKPASFQISDVDEFLAELVKARVSIQTLPHREETDDDGSQTYEFTVLDPERNPLTFWQWP